MLEEKLTKDARVARSALVHIDKFYDENPFLALLGVTVEEFSWGHVRLDVDIAHKLTNVYGIVHGGVTFTLADTAMGGACLGCNKRVVTLAITTNFVKPVAEGSHAYAIGDVIHNGAHTMICEGRVYNESGELCLKAQGTFYVLKEFTDDGTADDAHGAHGITDKNADALMRDMGFMGEMPTPPGEG